MAFVGLFFATLLLTGCGSGSSKNEDIRCTMKGEDESSNVYVYLTDGKVSSADIEYSNDSLEEEEKDCSRYTINYECEVDVICDVKTININNSKGKEILGLS